MKSTFRFLGVILLLTLGHHEYELNQERDRIHLRDYHRCMAKMNAMYHPDSDGTIAVAIDGDTDQMCQIVTAYEVPLFKEHDICSIEL